MFVSKKEYEKLEQKVALLERNQQDLCMLLVKMEEELNELRKPKEPTYFG